MKWQDYLLKVIKPFVLFFGRWHIPFSKKKITGKNYYLWRDEIQVGTVFLTTTQGEFSNLFNPVKIKHGGIYVGYQFHPEYMRAIPCVLESVGTGTRLLDLVTFLTTKDYVVALKPQFVGDLERSRLLKNAKKFVGIPYDYSFLKSMKAVYCFELVVAALRMNTSEKKFKTETILGREIYGPDTFLKDDRFEIMFTNIPEIEGENVGSH